MNYYQKKYYHIRILEEAGFSINWTALQVGLVLGVMDFSSIAEYAVSYLEAHPCTVNKDISELIFGVPDQDLGAYVARIINSLGLPASTKDTPQYVHLSRIWRYAILKYVMQTNQEPSELLQVVDDIYSDFGYPEDMIPAIWYRQVGNPEYLSLKSDSEREQYLLKQLYVFLERQKELIAQGPSQDTFGFNMKFAPE